MVTLRWIEREELDRLKPVIEEHHWTPLDPVFSKALIAEDEQGNIVGFNVLQMVLRPEPLWVEKSYRGEENGLAMDLATTMIDHLKQAGAVYWEVRAKNPYVERLCQATGMEKIQTPMFAGGV